MSVATPTPTDDDPRLTGEFVRRCPGDDGDVVLVGVVHDHPASKYRVAAMAEALDPDTLALELPPLALPLFEAYADDAHVPPALGGEMSAAIQAADTDRVVGVDGPSAAFTGRLLGTLLRERASRDTAASALRALASVTKHAAVCRLASVAARGPFRVEVDALSTDYETSPLDDPAEQADDERRQVRKANSVLEAFGTSPASRLRNETREAHMADRLEALRRDGDVLAVVGIDHLDPVADRLA